MRVALSYEKVTLLCPYKEIQKGCGMPGTVNVPNFSGTSKDPKRALQKLAERIVSSQLVRHFVNFHNDALEEQMDVDSHDIREIDDKEKERQFWEKEKTFRPTLREMLEEIRSSKEGYTALPSGVKDQLTHFEGELKLTLSNVLVISVKNGAHRVLLG